MNEVVQYCGTCKTLTVFKRIKDKSARPSYKCIECGVSLRRPK